jgi:hypothetical protein
MFGLFGKKKPPTFREDVVIQCSIELLTKAAYSPAILTEDDLDKIKKMEIADFAPWGKNNPAEATSVVYALRLTELSLGMTSTALIYKYLINAKIR